VAGNGDTGVPAEGTPAVLAALNMPTGVAIDGAGNLYIADTKNNAVRVVSSVTGLISTVAGSGTVGYSGDGGSAKAAMLNEPWGVTVDTVGNLYIADTNNHVIRKVTISTGTITTVAGNGTAGYSGDRGLAIDATLNFPYAVAFDNAGNMLIPDSANNVVRKVDTAGTISTLAGNGANGYSGDGKAASQAQLWSPEGVAVDPAGNIYIADSQNNAIRKISFATGNISTTVATGLGESVIND
jgi:sugar lactone lactonase YvrE